MFVDEEFNIRLDLSKMIETSGMPVEDSTNGEKRRIMSFIKDAHDGLSGCMLFNDNMYTLFNTLNVFQV